jgi:hypothetical protein
LKGRSKTGGRIFVLLHRAKQSTLTRTRWQKKTI